MTSLLKFLLLTLLLLWVFTCSTGHEMRLGLLQPAGSVAPGKPVRVELVLENLGRQPLDGLYITTGRELLEQADIAEIVPAPKVLTDLPWPSSTRLWDLGLAPIRPGTSQLVTLQVVPRRAGAFYANVGVVRLGVPPLWHIGSLRFVAE